MSTLINFFYFNYLLTSSFKNKSKNFKFKFLLHSVYGFYSILKKIKRFCVFNTRVIKINKLSFFKKVIYYNIYMYVYIMNNFINTCSSMFLV